MDLNWTKGMNISFLHDFRDVQLSFSKDLQIRRHFLDGCHYHPRLCSPFVIQEVESPSVLRRNVIEEASGMSFGSKVRVLAVMPKSGSEVADADQLRHREGAIRI